MRKTLHPVQWLMAIAIIAFCLTGTAAFMGWLPNSDAALKPELLATAEPTEKPATEPAPAAILSPADVSPTPTARIAETPAPVATQEAPPATTRSQPAPVAAAPRQQPTAPAVQPVARYCPDCGVVASVETLNRRGKTRRTRYGLGKKVDTKRAIVTVAEGDRIDIFSGPVD